MTFGGLGKGVPETGSSDRRLESPKQTGRQAEGYMN